MVLRPRTLIGIVLAACLLGLVGARSPAAQSHNAQRPATTERTFQVTARKFSFAPSRLEVTEGDLVRVELQTDDIAHSFTIDGYRLSKRVDPGHPSIIEFRADRAGAFPYYCNLQIDNGCRRMRGELVVKKKN
jgi:heme/copper-type cytochrome/quinol oxidase subunit 2